MKSKSAKSADVKQLASLLKRRIGEVSSEDQLAELTNSELEESVGGIGHTIGMIREPK